MELANKIDLILTAIRMVCQIIIVGLLLVIIKYQKFSK